VKDLASKYLAHQEGMTLPVAEDGRDGVMEGVVSVLVDLALNQLQKSGSFAPGFA